MAEKVQRRLLERVNGLLVTPNVGRKLTKGGVRRLSVPDIQYVIDYRLGSDVVQIIRIHSAREIR